MSYANLTTCTVGDVPLALWSCGILRWHVAPHGAECHCMQCEGSL